MIKNQKKKRSLNKKILMILEYQFTFTIIILLFFLEDSNQEPISGKVPHEPLAKNLNFATRLADIAVHWMFAADPNKC